MGKELIKSETSFPKGDKKHKNNVFLQDERAAFATFSTSQ